MANMKNFWTRNQYTCLVDITIDNFKESMRSAVASSILPRNEAE